MYFFIYYCVALLPMSPVLMRSLSRSHLHTHTTTETIWLVFILLLLSFFFFAVNTAASSLLSLYVSLSHSRFTACARMNAYTRLRMCVRSCIGMCAIVCRYFYMNISAPAPLPSDNTEKLWQGPELRNDGGRRAGSGPLPIWYNGLNSCENI